MEFTDFVKADSRNLAVEHPFMMAAYFNALHGSSLDAGRKTPICLLFSGGGGAHSLTKNI